MERRKVTDAHEARTLLEEHLSSGMTQALFARSRGIDGRSLNAWRMNLERSKPVPKDLQFLELMASEPAGSPSLTVRCGPFAVDVPSQFNQARGPRVGQMFGAWAPGDPSSAKRLRVFVSVGESRAVHSEERSDAL